MSSPIPPIPSPSSHFGKWIPAAQPPDTNRAVVIYDPDLDSTFWIGHYKRKHWYLFGWDPRNIHNVTHWAEIQPAPAPTITGFAASRGQRSEGGRGVENSTRQTRHPLRQLKKFATKFATKFSEK